MFGKWANILNLLLSQLNLTNFYEEIISCTPQGREKLEDCAVIFLDYIWNHCNFIGFNWKVMDLRYLLISQIYRRKLVGFKNKMGNCELPQI